MPGPDSPPPGRRLRRGSPTFGRWVGEVLSERSKNQLWIPEGFAHGFLVLSEQAEFLYKTTDYYVPEHERSLLWNDPAHLAQGSKGAHGLVAGLAARAHDEGADHGKVSASARRLTLASLGFGTRQPQPPGRLCG